MSRRSPFVWIIAAIIMMMTASFAAAGPRQHTGTVVEAVTGGGYTYMNIDEGGQRFWIAGPETSIGEGASVSFLEQLWMINFKSKALDRTFDRIMFVGGVSLAGGAPGASPARPAPGAVDLTAAKRYTVEEIFARKDELKGRPVEVHGNVVKVSNNIMGRTWVHIEDGTGGEGSNRVIFRSRNQTAEVGSAVTARGILDTDKDFGFGYYYSVIVEESTFSK